ncbi:MAG: hypothetical protein JNK82_16760 [Myxococcaceae bacterium]|nr:hypothetical protein [Myxococcaceae bacterium]
MAQAKRKEREDGEGEADGPKVEAVPSAADNGLVPFEKPARLQRNLLIGIGVVALAINFPIIHYFLLRGAPEATVGLPYQDDFSDPSTVQKHYWSTGGLWRSVDGQLVCPGVKQNPLWLKAKLPQNVAVEFDARSQSPEGDIKVEIFGDGMDHASGYVLIHGGWNNSLSIIARRDEHGRSLQQLQAEAQRVAAEKRLPSAGLIDTGVFNENSRMRVEANPYPVQIGRTYRWRIERRGSKISWAIDGQPFMEFDDPIPLTGEKHNRFGFSCWEAQLYFDNLRIEPLN